MDILLMSDKLMQKNLILGNAQSCTATNGKKCIFPFVHKGRKFNGCTKFNAPAGDPAWCSTKVRNV